MCNLLFYNFLACDLYMFYLHWILKQGYRVVAVLVTRQWCLAEVCFKQEIISIVTDPHIETSKPGLAYLFSTLDVLHTKI